MGNKHRYRLRNVISLSLFFISPIFIFSGIALYLRPEGSIARWTRWTFLGLDKGGWETLHISCATIFIIIFLFHIFYNYKSIFNYLNLKISSGKTHIREIVSAFVLTFVVLVSALAIWEPVVSIMDLRKTIKNGDDLVNIPPPVSNAEEFSLLEIARMVDAPLDNVTNTLRLRNYNYSTPDQSLRDIAENNNIAIEKLYIAIIESK
jgi:hypothetical protein